VKQHSDTWSFRLGKTLAATTALAPLLAGAGGCSLDQFRKDPVYVDPTNTCEQQALIDNCEDRDDQILLRQNRGGYIYTFVDTVGSTISPTEGSFKMERPGAAGSKYAMHVKGKLAATGETFAGVGMDLRSPRGGYNASRYKGVSFLAKTGPNATSHVRFSIPDINTDKDGKVCTECFNAFGIGVELTEEWTRYEVAFSELKQDAGWGNPRPPAVDASKLFNVQWQVSAPGSVFDIWIDDVSFIGCP
jgi:hypothetical protein